MEVIEFLYLDAKSVQKAWQLSNWKEVGKYISGVCINDKKFRTFRKDRVIQYYHNVEAQLIEPHPEPPAIGVKSGGTRKSGNEVADVLFTGFAKARRAELEKLAAEQMLTVRKSVTEHLTFLCCGENAGPKKIEASREKGTFIMTESSFLTMLETGELMD